MSVPEHTQEIPGGTPLPTQPEYESLIDRLGIRHLLMGWWWDDEDKVYRQDETGDEMNEEEMISLRDQIADWQVDYFSKWPLEEEEKPKTTTRRGKKDPTTPSFKERMDQLRREDLL